MVFLLMLMATFVASFALFALVLFIMKEKGYISFQGDAPVSLATPTPTAIVDKIDHEAGKATVFLLEQVTEGTPLYRDLP